jgi:protease-4
MNALGTFFRGLWRGLDGLRKFLHLLLLLLIFGFIFGALRVSIPKIPTTAALIVAPEGQLVEQLSGDPLQRAFEEAQGIGRAETLLWDVVDSVRAAANDKRIKVLVLDLDYLGGAGQPALEELARAIREFRASGKQVISYGTMYLQDQYYLAAQANEVYLDPLGFVLIDGYDRYRWFWKGTLDKLGVQMNVFRVGAYKSAVEVYTRTDMSPEEREESLAYLNSLWGTYQRAITKARKLKQDAIANYVGSFAKTAADLGGKTAQIALKAGLVTALKSRIEVEQRLIELVGEDENTGSFRAVTDQEYSRIVKAEKALSDGQPTIGVVVASGEILDGEQPPGTVGGDSTARLIRDAREDDSVKAIVLRVDSPGGSVTASEQIYRELMAAKRTGKPVVVSMGSLAASGGYYISAPADEIWASPATLTGSIGIFAVVPTFSETMGKAGLTVDGVGTTPLSGQLRVDRPLGEEARMVLQSTIQHGYEVFLERVSTGREKTRDQVDAIAQGRVWSGVDAKRVGLVDQLGSFDDAVKAAAKRAKLAEYRVEFVEPELSWAQELALQVKVWGVRMFGSAAGAANRELKPALQMARQLDPLRAELERLSRFTMPNRLYAYCFCAAN